MTHHSIKARTTRHGVSYSRRLGDTLSKEYIYSRRDRTLAVRTHFDATPYRSASFECQISHNVSPGMAFARITGGLLARELGVTRC